MTPKKKGKPGPKAEAVGRSTYAVRLYPDIKQAVDKAVAKLRGCTLSDYIEEAIRMRLVKEGHLKAEGVK